MCMVARWDDANVQLHRDSLTFSTKRAGQSQGFDFSSWSQFATHHYIVAGGQRSPAKNPSKMFATSSLASAPVSTKGSMLKKTALYASDKGMFVDTPNLRFVLFSPYSDILSVPVLDGRGSRLTFNMVSDLDNLGAKLPEFRNEVPKGSFAWVGYSVNTFQSQKGNNFSMNLLWVVVVGTPED